MESTQDTARPEPRSGRRALVVHESMFGNTARVADAVRVGLAEDPSWTVDLAPAHDAPVDLEPFDLVVVGAPTHAFGLPSERTRQAAVTQASHQISAAPQGVREWLAALQPHPGAQVATFDTRVKPRWIPGSAAARTARRLRARGMAASATESFRVEGTEGPLMVGELARARDWGRHLREAADRESEAAPRRRER